MWQERGFFIYLLTKQCDTKTVSGKVDVCIVGVEVGSNGGDRFSVIADVNGDVAVTRGGAALTLPFHHHQFFIKDVTANVTVVDMEDIRVVFYPAGYVRVEADSSKFYNSVRKGEFL